MSLTQCNECHKNISALANRCPFCGYKKPNVFFAFIKLMWGMCLLFVAGMILYFMFG
jgi:hypothetical protein